VHDPRHNNHPDQHDQQHHQQQRQQYEATEPEHQQWEERDPADDGPIVICFSGFKKGAAGYEPDDKAYLTMVATTIFNATVLEKYGPSCTHLICPKKARTMKTIQAILEHCWVGQKEWLVKSAEAKKLLPSSRYGFRCTEDLFGGKVFQMSQRFEEENKKEEKRKQQRIANLTLIVKLGNGTMLDVDDRSCRPDYTLHIDNTVAPTGQPHGTIIVWQQFLDLIPMDASSNNHTGAGAGVGTDMGAGARGVETPIGGGGSARKNTDWKSSLKRGSGQPQQQAKQEQRDQQPGTTPIPFNQGRPSCFC
jgi:hypothetical protein